MLQIELKLLCGPLCFRILTKLFLVSFYLVLI